MIVGDELAVRVAPQDAEPSLFEVGSIGKTMTATVLAMLVADGTVALDDGVSRWIDAGPHGDITLEQLATHTSGLPRIAPNAFEWEGFDEDDPYRGFTADHAEAGLRMTERAGVGTEQYSNFGYQLLGLVLCRAAGLSFDELMRSRLWEPIGMATSCVASTGGEKVQGYASTRAVPPWHAALPGPGAIDVSVADIVAYLSAVLTPPPGPVGAAIRLTVDRGLAWVKTPDGLVWHNGGTAGFRSMLVVDPAARRGAVAIVNNGALGELDQAVAHAARDEDPHLARPQAVGNDYDERVDETAALVVTEDWDALRAAMTADTREAITVEMLRGVWADAVGSWGPVVSHQRTQVVRLGELTRAEVVITFRDGDHALTLVFDADRQLAGLNLV